MKTKMEKAGDRLFGLGKTSVKSSKLLHALPWFSTDSTGWIASRKYAVVIDVSGQWPAARTKDKKDWTGEMCMAYTCSQLSLLETAAVPV